MTHAQRILLASHAMLQAIQQAGIEIDLAWRLAFYARIEAWCGQAQLNWPLHP